MQYYVDGYNLFFKKSKAKPSFEKNRRNFLDELNHLTEKIHASFVIVFDGAKTGSIHFQRSHYKDLEVIYTSSDQTADEYILEVVTGHHRPKDLVIVSSDRELTGRSRQLGAAVMSIKEFVAFLEKKHHSGIKKSSSKISRDIQENPQQFSRLLKLFEGKLKNIMDGKEE